MVRVVPAAVYAVVGSCLTFPTNTSRSFADATGFVNVNTVVDPFGVNDCFGNELTKPCVGVVPINGLLYSYVICIKPRTASSDEAALA